MSDPYHLHRFLDAQQTIIENVYTELREGKKRNHWMWFIFPQIEGLGQSDMARKFAISSLEEAKAYLEHPVLGTRLRECSRLVATTDGGTIEKIFGYPDNLKFHSCMTLFAQAATDNQIFNDCLEKYFGGKLDLFTLAQL